MIPVNRNTNMEIPILKTNRKKTVPKRLMVFVMVRLVLLLSSISSATIFFSVFAIVGIWAGGEQAFHTVNTDTFNV